MRTEFMVNQLIDVIKKIPTDFGVYEDDDDFPNSFGFQQDVRKAIGNAYVCNGASKAVIISPFCDEVIKLPFSGMFSISDEIDPETGEIICEDCESFHEFDGAEYTRWNYCETELIRYDRAVEDGYEKYFAAVRSLGTFGDTPVYAQEKVYELDEGISMAKKPSEASKSAASHFRIDSEWAAVFIENYDEEELERFEKYLDDHNMFDDLHRANIGFRLNGEPVLIDFSGFDEY